MQISKNTYFEKHLQTSAFEIQWKFFDHELLSFWTCYEKRIACAFAPTQFSLD